MDSLGEYILHTFKTVEPIQYFLGVAAVCGGVARYLNTYIKGEPFKFRILVASIFVSGFTGWMFGIMGISLNMPQSMLFVMAGSGGFFGDQTMKFIMEYLQRKSQP